MTRRVLVAATDASTRTVEAADFKCGGANPDNVEIDKAVAAAGPGGRVDLSEGTFTLANRVSPRLSGFHMQGNGQGITTVRRAEGYYGNLLDFWQAKRLTLRDLTINDAVPDAVAETLQQSAMALRFWRCQDVSGENIDVQNGFRLGITIGSCQRVYMRHCEANGTRGLPLNSPVGGVGGHGFVVAGAGPDELCRDIHLIDCIARDNWRTGLCPVWTDGLFVRGWTLHDNMPRIAFDHGIECGGQLGVWVGCRNVQFTDNDLWGGFDTQGIEIDTIPNLAPGPGDLAATITVKGNQIRDQGRAGIMFYRDPRKAGSTAAHAIISNNRVVNCGTRGIVTWYGDVMIWERLTQFQITDNEVFSTRQPAIRLMGGNDSFLIEQNRLNTNNPFYAGERGVLFNPNASSASRLARENLLHVNGAVLAPAPAPSLAFAEVEGLEVGTTAAPPALMRRDLSALRIVNEE